MLYSLASETQPAFDALVATNRIRKRYLALVRGKLPATGGDSWLVVDAPIARDRHDARRMRVGSTGRPSQTRVRIVERRGAETLVEAELVTGRRHQIRVHLAHLGCPIVGDALYGYGTSLSASGSGGSGGAEEARGLCLHAHELQFTHPLSGRRLTLESPCPWRDAMPS